LTLENTETSGISSFSKNNSTFPALFMQENIYSFEVNLRPEEQTIILPSENDILEPPTTTTTILGSTEIITTATGNDQGSMSSVQEETTTTTTTTVANIQGSTSNSQEETTTTTTNGNNQYPISNIQNETTTTEQNNQDSISNIQNETTTTTVSDETTTSTIQEETTTTVISETTTTVTEPTTTTEPPTTTTTIGEEPLAKIKMAQPLLGLLSKNFKSIGVLGFLADVTTNVLENIETITSPAMPINGNIVLSGFVLPELLEDEVLTQFSEKKENEDILNVKLGMSLANKHVDINTDANLTIETFKQDH
jgi:hypothetical protein